MTPIQLKKQELKKHGILSGEAQTPELKARADGIFQIFDNYTIVYHRALGTFYIPSEIYKVYEKDGGLNKNPLGFPICDVTFDEDNETKTSLFELGKIISNPKEGIKTILNDAVFFKRTHVSIKINKSDSKEEDNFI